MRWKFMALALVACGVLVLAAGASGRGASPTSVTIKEQNGDFHGKVSSPNPDCIARTVTVRKKRDGKDLKINSDATDRDGKWNTGNTHVGHGKYYARARPVFGAMKKGPILVCATGKSRTVTVN